VSAIDYYDVDMARITEDLNRVEGRVTALEEKLALLEKILAKILAKVELDP
jgi:hypothetical protein